MRNMGFTLKEILAFENSGISAKVQSVYGEILERKSLPCVIKRLEYYNPINERRQTKENMREGNT